MNRAYSTLDIKSVDEEQRVITGFASTPEPDRLGDVIEPRGASFKLPLPLLWQHRASEPIGHVLAVNVTDTGIEIQARIAKGVLPRIDEAWALIKAGLVRGLSIGFRPTKDPELIKGTFGLKFTDWEWLELSAVTIPANAGASIQMIKSIDTHDRAASGEGQGAKHVGTPGVTGTVVRLAKKDAPTTMKTITDQIKEFEATRAAKAGEQRGLMDVVAEKGETLDEAGGQKYDELSSEIKSIDQHLVRLRDMEAVNKAAAVPVQGQSQNQASASRAGTVISVKANRPPGIGMARATIAKVMASRDGVTVKEYIQNRWPDDGEIVKYFQKAAVPAGTTTDLTWAGNLVTTTNLESEFLEFLRPQTIIGRIPGLRNVPFNVRVTGQSTGAVANWVGQGKAKPVTSFSTTSQTLLFTKIAAIAVITEELARFSSPSAETLVRDELARAVIERMDVDFIDPASAAVTGVNPASITNGVTPLSSAGATADNIRTDLIGLLSGYVENNTNPTGLVLIMPNSLALAASLMVTSLGVREFPDMTMNGGSILGIPVVTSQYAANQSGSGNLVIAVNAPDIFLAQDDQVRLDSSREASIEMSDAPAHNSGTPTGASLVSMYQTNSIAIRAERYINWLKARTNAVAFIDDVNWGSVGSPS